MSPRLLQGVLSLLAICLVSSSTMGAIISQKTSGDFNLLGVEGDSLIVPTLIGSAAGFSLDGLGNLLYNQDFNGHVGHTGQFFDSIGWTVEAAVKVDTPNGATGLVAQISAGDDVPGYYQINIAQTQFQIPGSAAVPHDFTQRTVVRMAKEAETDQVQVWLNGVDQGLFGPANATLARSWQVIGDGTGTATGAKILIDYLRKDSTGAFAPVPEPATGVLVLLGMSLIGTRLVGRSRN